MGHGRESYASYAESTGRLASVELGFGCGSKIKSQGCADYRHVDNYVALVLSKQMAVAQIDVPKWHLEMEPKTKRLL